MEAHYYKMTDDPVSIRATAQGTQKMTGVVLDPRTKAFKHDADLMSAATTGNRDWSEHEIGIREAETLCEQLGGSWQQLTAMLSSVDS